MSTLTLGNSWSKVIDSSELSSTDETSIKFETKNKYLDRDISITIPKVSSLVSIYNGETIKNFLF